MKNKKNLKRLLFAAGTTFALFIFTASFTACSNHILDIEEALQSQPATPSTPTTPEPTPTPPSPTTYTITITSSEHGSITVDKTTAEAGATITITVSPDSGYVLDTLTATDANGSSVAISDSNTFTMPETNVTVSGTFKIATISYSITVATGITNGSISVDKNSATAGETVTITITPDSGYKLNVIIAKDSSGNAIVISATNTFTMPDSDVTVNATFKESYTISCVSGEHGTISVDKTSAARFEKVTITTTPASGYVLDTITYTDSNGNEVSIPLIAPYYFYMPDSNVTVNATFRLAKLKMEIGINVILINSMGADSTATKFIHSTTPPASGITTCKLSDYSSDVDVLAWLDGTTIKFYAEGYTDSNKKIPLDFCASMFDGCSSLQEIDMSYFDTSNVTSMVAMFHRCENLETLTLSNDFKTSNVTSMLMMFLDCKKLTTLNLSNFDTSNVTNMEMMFSGCISLTKIITGTGFDTSNVTSSNYMFSSCTSLVGEAGTNYDYSNPSDKTYACIDGENGLPGYFSRN